MLPTLGGASEAGTDLTEVSARKPVLCFLK